MQPITLIVPVYNERASCGRLMARVGRVLERLAPGSEVVLVDDGSTDGSAEELERAVSGAVRLVRHGQNRGYGAALKTGLEQARHEWIAITDADGTYPLGALPALLAALEGGARMAVGARRPADLPAVRRPAKAFLNAFASYLAGRRIPDLNSGLRVFRRQDALRLGALLPDGFSFTSTLTMALAGAGHPIAYVPIRYGRRVGQSKIRPLRDTAGFLLLVCRMAMAFNPLRVFGPAGGALLAAGFVLLVARMLMPERPFGIATTIVLAVGGLQVLAIGLLADLINRRGGSG
jgi:glycosyltransferase involved in cell wall biosynthesis